MKDDEKIKSMEENDTIFVRMFQEGGFQIHKYNYEYLLYEIPLYGGVPVFIGIYRDIEKIIATMDTYN